MKQVLLAAITILVLTGCHKGTTIVYRVINHSGEQVTFTSYYNYNYGPREHVAIVPAGETRDILLFGKETGRFEDDYTAGKYIDSVKGMSNTDKRLTKNLASAGAWTQVTTKKSGLHNFTTEITAKDLQ